jgi:hypothetical protein
MKMRDEIPPISCLKDIEDFGTMLQAFHSNLAE